MKIETIARVIEEQCRDETDPFAFARYGERRYRHRDGRKYAVEEYDGEPARIMAWDAQGRPRWEVEG